jgi:hypothetical protein
MLQHSITALLSGLRYDTAYVFRYFYKQVNEPKYERKYKSMARFAIVFLYTIKINLYIIRIKIKKSTSTLLVLYNELKWR